MAPFRLPNKDKSGYHGETTQDEQDDADVADPGAEPAGQWDPNGAHKAEWKLEEDALEGGVAKRGDDEGTKA